MKFSDLAERQILKAQSEGQLDNLKGAGKPLDATDGSTDAIGFRIMAEAGALPREVQLRKAVEEQTRILRQTRGEEARRREAAENGGAKLVHGSGGLVLLRAV